VRVAFTGSSSTGKTALAHQLMKEPTFRAHIDVLVPSPGRDIRKRLRLRPVVDMSRDESRLFEIIYFSRKVWQESLRDRFVTDRSFVDVAAIWIERDSVGLGRRGREFLVEQCRLLSTNYDFHVFFPRNVIPFVEDGVRSLDQDYHRRIEARIRKLLRAWDLEYITLVEPELESRVAHVLERANR
jgi:AAA domain